MIFRKSALLLLSSLALAASESVVVELAGLTEAKIDVAKSEAPPKCGCGEDEILFDFSNFQQNEYVEEISQGNLFVKAIGNMNPSGGQTPQFYTPNLAPNGGVSATQPDDVYGNPEGGAARILNSADPQPDFDLGSPNEKCPNKGPGKGNAGEPGQQGENCNALGNILIIQRRDKDRADDSDEGGEFVFTVDRSTKWRFIGIGVLDIPAGQQVDIYTSPRNPRNAPEFHSYFSGVGKNGYQEYGEAADAPVRFHDQVRVVMPGHGGIAWIKFCRNWDNGSNKAPPKQLPDGAVQPGRRQLRA